MTQRPACFAAFKPTARPGGRLVLLSAGAALLMLAGAAEASADYVGGLDRTGDNFLSLRVGPGTNYAETRRMLSNTTVVVIGRSGDWVHIRLNDGATGWASGRYILAGSPGSGGYVPPARDGYVPPARDGYQPPSSSGGYTPPSGREPAGATAGWTTYSNDRFGFSVEFPPAMLAMAPPPDNDDGRTFRSRDGRVEARVYGRMNIDSKPLAALRDEFVAEHAGASIGYNRVMANNFAVSGKAGGEVFYVRVYLSDDGALLTVLDVRYPEVLSGMMDSIVTRMSRSLVAGLAPEGETVEPPETTIADKPPVDAGKSEPDATTAKPDDHDLERLKLEAEIERLRLEQLKMKQGTAEAGPDKAKETPSKLGADAIAPMGRRVALVIGNGAYGAVTRLPTPAKDALAMAERLKAIGYDVIVGTDLNRTGMTERLAAFYNKAKGADVALFYFSGHGMQINGRNYLLPTDAQFQDESAALDVEARAIDLQKFLNAASGSRITVAFVDACRDNPILDQTLAKSIYKSVGGNVTKGLAVVKKEELSAGQFVGFAAEEGKTAQTGTGDVSTYTTALLKQLAEPGLDISILHRRVRREVEQATGGTQSPRAVDDLREELALVPAKK